MDFKQIAVSTLSTVFLPVIPSAAAALLIKIENMDKSKKFLYSYLGAFIPACFIQLINSGESINAVTLIIINLVWSLYVLFILKSAYSADTILKSLSSEEILNKRIEEYSMIKFIKEKSNIYFMIIYFLLGTASIFSSYFINLDFVQNFKISNFLFIFLLNIAPWIFMIILSRDLRNRIRKDDKVTMGRFIITGFVGGIMIGLTLIPVFIIIFTSMPKLSGLDQASIGSFNFRLNAIMLPVFYLINIYSLGVYAVIYSKMKADFSVKEILYIFKKPYIQVVLKWSVLFFIIPQVFHTAAYKFSNIPLLVHIAYYYITLLVALISVYLVMYIITLKDYEAEEALNRISDQGDL